MTPADNDPVKDAHAQIVQAIQELQAMGIEVPMSLHRAVHALHHATRKAENLPAVRPIGQS
jgi:hypothetical protein